MTFVAFRSEEEYCAALDRVDGIKCDRCDTQLVLRGRCEVGCLSCGVWAETVRGFGDAISDVMEEER